MLCQLSVHPLAQQPGSRGVDAGADGADDHRRVCLHQSAAAGGSKTRGHTSAVKADSRKEENCIPECAGISTSQLVGTLLALTLPLLPRNGK